MMTGKMTIINRMKSFWSIRNTVLFFSTLFFWVSPLFSQVLENRKPVPLPPTITARKLYAKVINGPIEKAVSLLPTLIQDAVFGNYINFFTEKKGGRIYFYFSLDSGITFKKIKKGSSVILRKLSSSGKNGVEEIRFYIKDDPTSYVSIIPDKSLKESLMSITLYGYVMQENIKIPLPIGTIVDTSFERIEDLTSAYVNWSFYFPDPNIIYSDDVLQLSGRIVSLLPFLHDSDDGAMNKNGRFVSISTLLEQKGVGGMNCSGFAKWIIDGMYYPKKGTYIPIDDLKKKYTGLRGNRWSRKLEKKYDPYFGLDWTRNLALKMAKLYDPEADYHSQDVNTLHFQTYVKDVGFPLKDLKVTMYECAVSMPEYFYLGSINMITDNPPGLRKHLHVVVVFPAIDSLGKFSYTIFSRNKVVTLRELTDQYPGAFIHLVKVRASTQFAPPGIRFDPTLRR